jgi:toxoflavin biosynthesis protein ToxD
VEPDALLPDRLRHLEFELRGRENAWAILPPTCLVPAGEFTMGSGPTHRSQFRVSEYEMPPHRVAVAAFRMATYPVTVAEYACAVMAGVVPAPQPPEWEAGQGAWHVQRQHPDAPVVYVWWTDAGAYARWLAQLTGRVWRLPTEVEWEKAARGTDERMFPWGDAWDERRANTAEGGLGHLAPVGLFPRGASAYGVEDLAGNVYEWCSTRFMPYPYRAGDGREDGDSPFGRVMRGGCWDVDAWNARAIGRNTNDEPYDAFAWVGVRLVCEAG